MLWIKRWLRRHRILAALVGIGAVLLNWLPQWIASVWSLYSSEPLFQWLGEHHLLRLTFSPLYITGPVSFILLGFILWGLFSPTRRHAETDSPLQSAPNLGMMSMAEGVELTGLVLSVLNFGYDKGAKRLRAQMIFRNNAAPQRTIANICFAYRAGGSSTTQLFNTQTSLGRYSVPINVITISNGVEYFLKCHAEVEPSLFEKIDAQAGLLINFTDQNGRLRSRYIFILRIAQSETGYFYETEAINGFSLDLQSNETLKDIDSMRMFFAIVAKIKAGVNPLKALQEVNAEELESNDMLIQLCNDLVKHGHSHPFASIRDTIPENKWLDFLIAAKCQGLDLSNELELFDLLQARSPLIRPLF